MIRILAALAVLSLMTACGKVTDDLTEPTKPIGDFRLGHAAVVAPNLQKLLVSREASAEEWIAEVDGALERRFRRFEGSGLYHLGVSVEAYSLPPPIVPGKSALALRVTVWDDAEQAKLNSESKVFHIIQVFESRIASNREEIMTRLADTAARDIEDWLRSQQADQGWFTSEEDVIPGDVTEEIQVVVDSAAEIAGEEPVQPEVDQEIQDAEATPPVEE